jgi:hypothetical protein
MEQIELVRDQLVALADIALDAGLQELRNVFLALVRLSGLRDKSVPRGEGE